MNILMGIERNLSSVRMLARSLLILAFLASLKETASVGVGNAWDVTYSHKIPYPLRFLSWTRTDGSPFDIKTVSGIGRLPAASLNEQSLTRSNDLKLPFQEKATNSITLHKKQKRQVENVKGEHSMHLNPDVSFHDLITKLDRLDSFSESNLGQSKSQLSKDEEDFRGRREAEKQMKRINVVKNIESSSSPSESWAKQPISVEFRHTTSLDQIARVDRSGDDRITTLPRNQYAPKTEFFTSNRRQFSDSRESRDFPLPRQAYNDYDLPLFFRNYVRSRDYHVPSSQRVYPNRYRIERNYYQYPRAPVDMESQVPITAAAPPPPPPPPPSFYHKRHMYNNDDNKEYYMDTYNVIGPTIQTRPKRIIYYANLPEVVRKPVDTRNYHRYNGPFVHSSIVPNSSSVERNSVRVRATGSTVEPVTPRKAYNRYPYSVGYEKYSTADPWNKLSGYYEQIPQTVYQLTEDRDQKSDATTGIADKKLFNRARNEDQRIPPWSEHGATEVNVKENERIDGRQIFGRVQGYDDKQRYDDTQRLQNDRRKDADSEQALNGN